MHFKSFVLGFVVSSLFFIIGLSMIEIPEYTIRVEQVCKRWV
jgi:hypothetical protein